MGSSWESYTSASLPPRAVTVVPSARESSTRCSPPSTPRPTSLQPPSSSATEPSSCPSPSDSQPSIYVTFKVLQLVHVFRQRVTRKLRANRQATRNASSTNSVHVDGEFCRGVERQAYDEIDRYLGRKTRSSKGKKLGRAGTSCSSVLTGNGEGEKGVDWYVLSM